MNFDDSIPSSKKMYGGYELGSSETIKVNTKCNSCSVDAGNFVQNKDGTHASGVSGTYDANFGTHFTVSSQHKFWTGSTFTWAKSNAGAPCFELEY